MIERTVFVPAKCSHYLSRQVTTTENTDSLDDFFPKSAAKYECAFCWLTKIRWTMICTRRWKSQLDSSGHTIAMHCCHVWAGSQVTGFRRISMVVFLNLRWKNLFLCPIKWSLNNHRHEYFPHKMCRKLSYRQEFTFSTIFWSLTSSLFSAQWVNVIIRTEKFSKVNHQYAFIFHQKSFKPLLNDAKPPKL